MLELRGACSVLVSGGEIGKDLPLRGLRGGNWEKRGGNKMKLCVNCQWFESETRMEFAKCKRSKKISPVDGEMTPYPEYIYCKIQREDGILLSRLLGTCGKEARFFEEKKEATK